MLENKDLQAISDLITKSEAMLLDEMERYDKKNEKRFDKIDDEIQKLEMICNMTKNENDTINTLLCLSKKGYPEASIKSQAQVKNIMIMC